MRGADGSGVRGDARFLALSATIGNGPALATWFDSLVGKGQTELVEHRSRFINLQRHVWTGEDLKLLHPMACVSTKMAGTRGLAAPTLTHTRAQPRASGTRTWL
jgi:superfamily II RNA helicase